MSASCVPWQPKGPTVPWGVSSPALPPGKESDHPALRCTVASHQVLCEVWGTKAQKGRETIRECPKEGYRDGEGFREEDI